LKIPIYWIFFASYARMTFVAVNDSTATTHFMYPAIGGGHGAWAEYLHFFKISGLVTLVSLCTHPILFFGFMSSGGTILKSLLWGQTFAIFCEACLISWAARLPFGQTVVAAVAANLFSWQFAAMISYWLWL
jgi:hypothetical protein